MTIDVGSEFEVDNAWRLHPYADDEFCLEEHGDPAGRVFVATHNGNGKRVTILRKVNDNHDDGRDEQHGCG